MTTSSAADVILDHAMSGGDALLDAPPADRHGSVSCLDRQSQKALKRRRTELNNSDEEPRRLHASNSSPSDIDAPRVPSRRHPQAPAPKEAYAKLSKAALEPLGDYRLQHPILRADVEAIHRRRLRLDDPLADGKATCNICRPRLRAGQANPLRHHEAVFQLSV